jgi:hypothetical protein
VSLPAAFKKVTEARQGAERQARDAQLQRLTAAVAKAQAGSKVVKWGQRGTGWCPWSCGRRWWRRPGPPDVEFP